MKSKYLIILIFFALLSCNKKSRSLEAGHDTMVENLFKASENAVPAEPVVMITADYIWLTYKTRLTYQSENTSFDNANLALRIQKDSVIWFSATHLGFEVARAMFDKDSVKLLNRFQKEYMSSDYNQLSNKLGFWLTYPRLQALLTGDVIYDIGEDKKWFYKNDSSAFFTGTEAFLKVNTEVLKDRGRPLQTVVADTRSNNLLKVTNKDFSRTGASLLPMQTFVEIFKLNSSMEVDRKGISVELKHQRIDTLSTAPGFPFSIPSNYRRVVL
jgi:hypothetical protein